jgi:hypothetical protein
VTWQVRAESVAVVERLPRVRHAPERIVHRAREQTCLLHFVEHLGPAGISHCAQVNGRCASGFFGGALRLSQARKISMMINKSTAKVLNRHMFPGLGYLFQFKVDANVGFNLDGFTI